MRLLANTIAETYPTFSIFENKPIDFECPYCSGINGSYECKDGGKDVVVCCRCWRYFPFDEVDILESDKKNIKTHKKSYGTVSGKPNNINY